MCLVVVLCQHKLPTRQVVHICDETLRTRLHEFEMTHKVTAQSLINQSSNSNPFEAMFAYRNSIRVVASKARNVILELEDLPASRDCILLHLQSSCVV